MTRRTKINQINHSKNLVEGDYVCYQRRKIAIVVNDPVLKAITVKGPQVILYEDKDLEIFSQSSGSKESTNKHQSNSKTENHVPHKKPKQQNPETNQEKQKKSTVIDSVDNSNKPR